MAAGIALKQTFVREGESLRRCAVQDVCMKHPVMSKFKRMLMGKARNLQVTLGVTMVISTLELLLIDRKYGLFSGGFGQSRVIDLPSELIFFGVSYGAAQALLASGVWWLAVRLTRRQSDWQALLLFSVMMIGGFALVLALQYQLHSYFSDAVTFALLKQLGGGSLADAILFGLNEISVAALAIAGGLLITRMTWIFLKRRFPISPATPLSTTNKPIQFAALIFLLLAAILPRLAGDAAYGLNRTLVWKALTNILNLASDFDKDGYGLFGIQPDDHPFDPKRYPYAFTVTGDRIDVFGLASNVSLEDIPGPRAHTELPVKAPNLIVIVMESARSDILGQTINGKNVAPNLEALAKSGSAAVPSFSHVGYTANSLKSIFSGQLEPQAGDPSLFHDLKLDGYRIGVFSGQPESFGEISSTLGMREHADIYIDAETLKEKRAFSFAAKGSLLVDERFLLDAFKREFGSLDKWRQPVFLYFNFQSPHFPYHHPGVAPRILDNPIPRDKINKENQEWLVRTYWNAVANADYWLGEVVQELKKIGVWNNTVLFVTGDHGEELFEGGFLGHGHLINKYQYQTFLISNRAGVIPAPPISLRDYRNIILDALAGRNYQEVKQPAFMYVGPLETPTQIGMADRDGVMTTLRLDTREVCFVEETRCHPYQLVTEKNRRRVDLLVQRWISEVVWRSKRRSSNGVE